MVNNRPSNWNTEASRKMKAIARAAVRTAIDDQGWWVNPMPSAFASEVRYDASTGYFEVRQRLGSDIRMFHRRDPGDACMALYESWSLELTGGYVKNPYQVVQNEIIGGGEYYLMTDKGDF